MRGGLKRLLAAAAVSLLPSLAFAQATLTGTVKDASGGVLPGVTVEASSAALTERTRTVATDNNGVYRIIELNPGTYEVGFALQGFGTVRQTGIQLAGTQVITIPIELKVGAVQETITVTGETPAVDVQSVKREMVMDAEAIQGLPGTRAVGNLLNATPGITVDNNGIAPTPTMTFFSARGGQANEGRMTVNGMTVAAPFNGGGVSSYIHDSVNVDEVSVVVSGGMGETDIGGPVMNLIPRAGGNDFRGQFFINDAGEWSKGNNVDDELRAVGIDDPPGIISAYDWSASYGGPIKRDRLWFFGSYRKLDTSSNVEGIVANRNAFDASRWDWVADDTITARQLQGRTMYIGRLTAQASRRDRISFNHEYQLRCEGSPLRVETDGCHTREAGWVAAGSPTTSPEGNNNYFDFPYYMTQVLWANPFSNRVLFEAGFTRFSYYHAGGPGQVPPDGIFDQAIGVTEQSTNINPLTNLRYAPRANYQYRAIQTYTDGYGNPNNWRASASYVTGSHNMKVGYQGTHLRADATFVTPEHQLSYQFNQGAPNQFTVRLPTWQQSDLTRSAAFFVQDAWTRGRMTLQGALRYDRAWSYMPSEHNGTALTSRFNEAPFTFEAVEGVNAYNDITPRVGVAFDVFGNGKTAVKFNFGHYLDAATNDSIYTQNNAASRIVRTFSRNWVDHDGDRQIDCDILSSPAQSPAATGSVDTCGAITGNNLNFGRPVLSTTVDPQLLSGWGVRENDWQFGINVQQELLPRVSLDFGYNRRWWDGFTVTDNTLRTHADYQAWTITAPADPRLPGGGNYPITLYTITSEASGRGAQNLITPETTYGPKRTRYWHGLDVSVNARLQDGLQLQAGASTGRTYEDSCDTTPTVDNPNTANVTKDIRSCLDREPWLTGVRGSASYSIPVIEVRFSATIASRPGLERTATWQVPISVVQSLLGRIPPGSSIGGTPLNVALLDTNDHRLYSDRRNQLDMRVAKILRFGGMRADLGLDLTNLLNTNYPTAYENTYQYGPTNGGTWNNPTTVVTPRFVRLNATLNF